MNTQTTTMNHKNSAKDQDAMELLIADHKLVSGLFSEFEKTESNAEKKRLASKICKELTVHAQIEEEIFYPAVKSALKDKELIPEARVEHQSLKSLIEQLEETEADAETFDATIRVMGEYVKHHVKEEQDKMFPKAKSTSLNMYELGNKLSERKAELLAK